jgi:C1A family cysteine protease
MLVDKLDLAATPFPMERVYEYIAYNKSIQQCQRQIAATTVQVTAGYVVAKDQGQAIEDAMAAWVYYKGPITVSVKAYAELWNSYDSGVAVCPGPTVVQQLDHAVTIVGYGTEGGVKYWRIKNSWTPRWGESGYIRIQRGVNACGVAFTPVVVSVSS